MCEIRLTDARTIGGYVVESEASCLEVIAVGNLAAWFVSPEDEHLVLIDSTREPLMRLKPASDMPYFDKDDFYAVRENR